MDRPTTRTCIAVVAMLIRGLNNTMNSAIRTFVKREDRRETLSSTCSHWSLTMIDDYLAFHNSKTKSGVSDILKTMGCFQLWPWSHGSFNSWQRNKLMHSSNVRRLLSRSLQSGIMFERCHFSIRRKQATESKYKKTTFHSTEYPRRLSCLGECLSIGDGWILNHMFGLIDMV